MTFAIITHVPHGIEDSRYFAYGPYVREMNIWVKYAGRVIIVAPSELDRRNPIHDFYNIERIDFRTIKSFHTLTILSKISSLLLLPKIFFTILSAMRSADHIHLRCPGNVGLLGCVAQVFFPSKQKTAKYAGNWDPEARQPLSYRIQKWILSNTFLTRNMQVLVYGDWPGASANIKRFFTASYSQSEAVDISPRIMGDEIRMIFAGSLSDGKRPDYAVRIAEMLMKNGHKVKLSIFGSGREAANLQSLIKTKDLRHIVTLEENRTKDEMKAAYQKSHFLLLPSKSEGWPKVVAEAMFWGCIPVATPVSCVAEMLGYGSRGILLSMDIEADVQNILSVSSDKTRFENTSAEAIKWSRAFTTDRFESEIKLLMK